MSQNATDIPAAPVIYQVTCQQCDTAHQVHPVAVISALECGCGWITLYQTEVTP